MVSRKVDAIATWEPHLAKIKNALGDDIKIFKEPDIYSFPWNVVVSPKLKFSSNTVKKFIQALMDGEAYLKNNQRESIDISARYLRTNVEEVSKMWKGMTNSVSLDQALIINLERQVNLIKESQKLALPPIMVTKFVRGNELKELAPERYGIID